MYNRPVKCITLYCPNMSYHLRCLTCSAEEVRQRSLHAAQGTCAHGHSITGDYRMIKRLLPEYRGGQPQPGYMLDVCKVCLMALPERPYYPVRPTRKH
jgi:hypothetical protein